MPLKREPGGNLGIVASRAAEAADTLKAMASETRLMILCALAERELSVNALAQVTGQSQSSVSQHLARLRACGLVQRRRAGQTVNYRVRDGVALDLINTLCRYYAG